MGKRKRTDYKSSFGGVQIESPDFAKLLRLNRLTWTNRKNDNNSFVWGFKDGHIVTSSDPLTGVTASHDAGRVFIGTAGYVGIEGTKSFRDRVVKFLKRNATFTGYSPSHRTHI